MNEQAPEVWALTSYRAGETSQILALAEALEVPFRRVDVSYSLLSGLYGVLQLNSRAGTPTQLQGPWPRLLISAGLGNEPIARWIRQQSAGRTRLVFLGRTWAGLQDFDLVVTTPQYRLQSAANLIENPLTLHSISREGMQQAKNLWASRFGTFAGLQVGVLLGGDSGPYTFTENFAERLAEELIGLAAGENVRFLVTSSSRTPAGFLRQLQRRLTGEHKFHAWGEAAENPYSGILAWADLLVVTADSIAMQSEALATGKRVLLSRPTEGGSLRSALYRSAIRWGHRRWTRDVALVHQRLLQLGLIDWLADATPGVDSAQAENPITDYVEHTSAQVKQLLD